MQPGFNHNIRYRNRLFHVQTEDNGLSQPVLVTQVFISGQIVAVERNSYQELLEIDQDNTGRDESIRALMQLQHKRLLKNLVTHLYDQRINEIVPEFQNKDVPPEAAAAEAEDDATESPTIDVPGDELGAGISLQDASDEDLLRILDDEMRKQMPWSPTNPTGVLPEILSDLPLADMDPSGAIARPAADLRPSDELAAPRVEAIRTPSNRPTHTLTSTAIPSRPTVQRGRTTRRRPPAADTLVDFGLPAALRERLVEARAEQQRSHFVPQVPTRESRPALDKETKIDMTLRRRASSSRFQQQAEKKEAASRRAPPNDATLIDMDADQIKRLVEERKNSLRRSEAHAWSDEVTSRRPSTAGDKQPSILVVEPSLDDVILSYLTDED